MYCITSTLRYEYKRIIDKWRGIYLLVLFCYCCCFFLFCLLLLVCYCCCFFSLSFVSLSSFAAVILFLNSSSPAAAAATTTTTTTTSSSSAPVLKHHYTSFFAFSFCFVFAYHLKFFHCLLFPINHHPPFCTDLFVYNCSKSLFSYSIVIILIKQNCSKA